MNLHIPEHINKVNPYQPGKPIEETQREFGLERVVKLASNENPLGPSPKASEAVQNLISDNHRYPDGGAYALKNALSKVLEVSPDCILPGNGSNEIIDLAVQTFGEKGDAIVTSKGAFLAYKLSATTHGLQTIETELTPDFRFDLNQMLLEIENSKNVRMVFIANPNNPTGTYNTTSEIHEFLEKLKTIREGSVLAVFDYAYWEYVTAKDLPDPMELLSRYENTVITRTFSKIYGIAGVRIGYGVARAELISYMNRVRMPFNVNSYGLIAAEKALEDQSFVKKSFDQNESSKTFWAEKLKGASVPFLESQGNFYLVNCQKGFGKSGEEVFKDCLNEGVILRPIANYGFPDWIRVSFGTQEENEFAWTALEKLYG